jgi:hypothetical protein
VTVADMAFRQQLAVRSEVLAERLILGNLRKRVEDVVETPAESAPGDAQWIVCHVGTPDRGVSRN